MRHPILQFTASLALAITICQAQLSEYCAKTYVSGTAEKAVRDLTEAKAITVPADKQEALRDTRTAFRNALNAGVSVAACVSPDAQAKSLAATLEARRIDIQTGASGGGAGSTNLVASGTVPALLGLATEYGGLAESFSGTTATFRTTPAKLIAAMSNAYGPNATPPDDRTLWALQRLSLSVSFDTSRTTTSDTKTQNTLLANYRQLSQATARILLVNDRDPLVARNWNTIRAFSQSADASKFANDSRRLLDALHERGNYDQALEQAMNSYDALAIGSATPNADAVAGILKAWFAELKAISAQIPEWQTLVDSYVQSHFEVDKQHRALYKKISKAPTLSLEFALNRPPVVSPSSATGATASTSASTTPAPLAPDLSSAGLIYTASLLSSDYTLTAKANFFTEARPTMKGNFRDFQLAGKWDVAVGRLPSFISKGTLTFSGLYEHLHQKPLGITLSINDQTINQPGNIGIFQIKYSIPTGDSGVQIPISFTASNRTELIKEKEMRANIGISFDLDKLFSKPNRP